MRGLLECEWTVQAGGPAAGGGGEGEGGGGDDDRRPRFAGHQSLTASLYLNVTKLTLSLLGLFWLLPANISYLIMFYCLCALGNDKIQMHSLYIV